MRVSKPVLDDGRNQCCRASTKIGLKCKAVIRSGSTFSVLIGPAVVARRVEARRTGGRERSFPSAVVGKAQPNLRLTRIQDVVARLGHTINSARKGLRVRRVASSRTKFARDSGKGHRWQQVKATDRGVKERNGLRAVLRDHRLSPAFRVRSRGSGHLRLGSPG